MGKIDWIWWGLVLFTVSLFVCGGLFTVDVLYSLATYEGTPIYDEPIVFDKACDYEHNVGVWYHVSPYKAIAVRMKDEEFPIYCPDGELVK